MSDADEFADVRQDPDPIRRGRRATELLTLYQQRATELARLRKAAIEQAHAERGLSYTEIAKALGITKGRVAQIRSGAPTPERAFFGVGPVAVGVPYRYQTTDRERPLIAAEDAQAGEQVEALLRDLGFALDRFQIEPKSDRLPVGDAVVVCGPKSAPVAGQLLARDPVLAIEEDAGRWWIRHQQSAERFGSPTDEAAPGPADVAYVARHQVEGRVVVHIAGLHAIGSLGAVHYLANHLADLFRDLGNGEFSCVVRSQYDGLEIQHTEVVAGPFAW